jgi:hypothetical protein
MMALMLALVLMAAPPGARALSAPPTSCAGFAGHRGGCTPAIDAAAPLRLAPAMGPAAGTLDPPTLLPNGVTPAEPSLAPARLSIVPTAAAAVPDAAPAPGPTAADEHQRPVAYAVLALLGFAVIAGIRRGYT